MTRTSKHLTGPDADRNLAPESPGPDARRMTSRRAFLRKSGALVGSGVVVATLEAKAQDAARTTGAGASPPAIPESMKAPGAPVGDKLYGVPSKYEAGVIRNVPKNQAQYISSASRTPLGDLDGIITPSGLFYERHHGGVPVIDPAQHRLMLHGLVRNPLLFTVDELRRLPSISRIHFLECSGNPVYTKPYGKTASDLVGLGQLRRMDGREPEAAPRRGRPDA